MPYLQTQLPAGTEFRDRPESVLLVEDSKTFSSVLSHRFKSELDLAVTACDSIRSLRTALSEASSPFSVAVVDLNLPDSPHGEVLDLTVEYGIPTIVFTGSFEMSVRERVLERNVFDYVIKDNESALDTVVSTVARALENRKSRVLVVDDMSAARQSLVDLLRWQLFKVVEANTGKQALELLKEYPDIELVLTDYHMPDMDGYELTRRIRRKHSSDRLRIIGVSSSSDRLLSASFLKAGASDFVYRPFVTEELQCRISHNMETLSQIKKLRIAAACDYLTGLFNRRYFYDSGPKLIEQCLRSGEPCSTAILDIDHFKRLNDVYGHEIGDRVLKAVASKLQSVFTGSPHLLSRLGGEEFGMLLVGMNGFEATQFCENLRKSILDVMVAADDDDISVTASIGVAEVGGRETFENYLNAADQFLYMAKHGGRNQVYSDHKMVAGAALASAG